jgi:beta-glucosidase
MTNEGIHGMAYTKATNFPDPIGLGATWDRDLVYNVGHITGVETEVTGYMNIYAPILGPAHDPRWGRVVETFGEGPYLVAELSIEQAKGIQDTGVASTMKHYAVYSVPKGGRDGADRTDPHVTGRQMRELFLYPFKRVIRAMNPLGVMVSYNDYDGVPVAARHKFLTMISQY